MYVNHLILFSWKAWSLLYRNKISITFFFSTRAFLPALVSSLSNFTWRTTRRPESVRCGWGSDCCYRFDQGKKHAIRDQTSYTIISRFYNSRDVYSIYIPKTTTSRTTTSTRIITITMTKNKSNNNEPSRCDIIN
jgi:hypothetical protein